MKFRTLACAAAMAAVAAASDVHDLKTDTFEPFLKEHDLVLAEFFAPWCGHCKALAPEYEEAATTLKEKSIVLAKIDCTAEEELCQKQGVSGYPTLKLFRGPAKEEPYDGQRKAPAIVQYMTRAALPPVSAVTKDSFEEFKKADDVTIVSFFDKSDTKSNETFTSIAEVLRMKFMFGASNDADLAKAEGVKVPGFAIFKNFDEGKNVFDGKFDKTAIESFITVNSKPLVGDINPDTYADYMGAGLPLAYLFAETQEERDALAKEFKDIAEKQRGKINFATIDATAFGQHALNLNLEVGKWPAFAIQDMEKNAKYPLDQTKKVNAKDIGKMVDEFLAGKLEASIKSEPIPEKQDGPVTVVVAKNYDDIVLKGKKDVLLEFYAPWCGHCKALAPKWDDLGKLFSSQADSVVIAKTDATANDLPVEIAGFPTIKLFPANDKKNPVTYNGARTVEEFTKFIAENGSNKIDLTKEAAALAAKKSEEAAKAATASEDMQKQAPAASGAAEKIKDAAAKVADAVGASDDSIDEHDEL